MNPKPSTCASSSRAWRHPLRHLKRRIPGPHARLINTEYCEILRLYRSDIVVIRNSQRTSFHVIDALRMKFGDRGARTWVLFVVGVTDVSPIGSGEKVGGAFVASQLGGGILTGWKLEDIPFVRRVTEVAMKPPLLESIVHEGRNGTVVVREVLVSYVESPH